MRQRTFHLLATAGTLASLAAIAHGQVVMKMLVSSDGGATWNSNVNVYSGDHVDVLVTVSYLGTSTSISGFGSANFQPIVSNWDNTGAGLFVDRLSPIGQGGNTLGSMINAQANSTGIGSPNPYLTPTPGGAGGVQVPSAPYAPATYGRVLPMGRTFLDGANALTGFVHVNPPTDQTGRSYAAGTYLRIAQANVPDWFNAATNSSGGSGVNCSQLFAVGRTTNDPNFWGSQDLAYDPGDPDNGIPASYIAGANGHNDRRQNVQIFRFGIDLSNAPETRFMSVDAPLAGQQVASGTTRYIGLFTTNTSQPSPASLIAFGTGATQASVQSATISVNNPSPSCLAVLGLATLRRRRR
jgi:hypothetical protein